MEYQWFEALKSAIAANRQPQSRYLQMATVGLDGAPRNRTLVFRGFLEDTESPLFVTDNRSNKISELRGDDRCELSWYFPESWEQFRLRGQMQIFSAARDESDQRSAIWQNLSDAVRAQFYWPLPGDPCTGPDVLSTPLATDENQGPPDTFSVLALTVCAVDHLQLQPTQRRFYSDRVSAGWRSQEINP